MPYEFFFIMLCFVTVKCVYIDNSENILDPNSDIFLNSTQLISKYNYSPESHEVITKDGYILNLIRIRGKGPPILLLHGIGDSSDAWLVLGPKHSLAFRLANEKYDVWILNVRGNRYSKTHAKKLTKEEYWDFSFEEIGTYDLPATIDYILSVTMRKKLTYIGFSQGTTSFFVLCSLKPEYNNKINHAVILAPIAWLNNMKHPLAGLVVENLDALESFLKNQNLLEVFPFNEVINRYHALVCNISSAKNHLCALEINLVFGIGELTKLLTERLPVITSHTPAGFSSKTLLHYLQGCSRRRFQRYDEGMKQNLNIYSSIMPPEYNVSQISVPMTIFVSEEDWFSSVEDMKLLQMNLRGPYKTIIINKSLKFTHLEFIYGARVNSIINRPIVNIIKKIPHD